MTKEIDQLLEKGYLVLKKIIPLNFIDELTLVDKNINGIKILETI